MRRTRLGSTAITCFLLLFLAGAAPCGLAQEKTHTLQKGETLYQVARRFHVPLDLLLETNRIRDPARVPAGTVLRVPRVHVVGKGETLYSIARRYGVPLEALVAANGIRDSARLPVGRELVVPAGGKGARAETAAPAGASAAPQAEGRPRSRPSRVTAGPRRRRLTASVSAPSAPPGFWPLPGSREPLNGKLAGVTIRGSVGEGVRAVSTGKVVWVGPYRGFGKVVFVEASGGYVYVYAGNEHILVEVGEQVARGMEIGRLGRSAHGDPPRLIFMVYHRGRPVDPQGAPRI